MPQEGQTVSRDDTPLLESRARSPVSHWLCVAVLVVSGRKEAELGCGALGQCVWPLYKESILFTHWAPGTGWVTGLGSLALWLHAG